MWTTGRAGPAGRPLTDRAAKVLSGAVDGPCRDLACFTSSRTRYQVMRAVLADGDLPPRSVKPMVPKRSASGPQAGGASSKTVLSSSWFCRMKWYSVDRTVRVRAENKASLTWSTRLSRLPSFDAKSVMPPSAPTFRCKARRYTRCIQLAVVSLPTPVPNTPHYRYICVVNPLQSRYGAASRNLLQIKGPLWVQSYCVLPVAASRIMGTTSATKVRRCPTQQLLSPPSLSVSRPR